MTVLHSVDFSLLEVRQSRSSHGFLRRRFQNTIMIFMRL